MILTIISNAILCAFVLAVIVGGLAWAIGTAQRDRRGVVTASLSGRPVPKRDLAIDGTRISGPVSAGPRAGRRPLISTNRALNGEAVSHGTGGSRGMRRWFVCGY